jgi:hypothetical protein
MAQYVIRVRGKREEIIEAERADQQAQWVIFYDDDGKEVMRYAAVDLESYGLLSATLGGKSIDIA